MGFIFQRIVVQPYVIVDQLQQHVQDREPLHLADVNPGETLENVSKGVQADQAELERIDRCFCRSFSVVLAAAS